MAGIECKGRCGHQHDAHHTNPALLDGSPFEDRNGSFSDGGPTGLVLTHQVNVMLGGGAGFVAGPYVFDNNSITAAKGSSLGVTDCRQSCKGG